MGTTQRRTFTGPFKLETVLDYLRGHKPTAQLCREHDITENVLYRWKQQFAERAPHLFDQGLAQPGHAAAQMRLAELERMVGRLTMERDILKRLACACRPARAKTGDDRRAEQQLSGGRSVHGARLSAPLLLLPGGVGR